MIEHMNGRRYYSREQRIAMGWPDEPPRANKHGNRGQGATTVFDNTAAEREGKTNNRDTQEGQVSCADHQTVNHASHTEGVVTSGNATVKSASTTTALDTARQDLDGKPYRQRSPRGEITKREPIEATVTPALECLPVSQRSSHVFVVRLRCGLANRLRTILGFWVCARCGVPHLRLAPKTQIRCH